MKNMNWPNRLSILRIMLVPVCVLLLHFENIPCRIAALCVFSIAAATDFVDGWMARKYNLVTNFGKFIDPVADKLLVLSTLIALCGIDKIPAWVCIVILFRELAVDGLRLVAVEQGKVIAAGKLGKIKTVTQIVAIIYFLVFGCKFGDAGFFGFVGTLAVIAAAVMTLWSGVDYFVRNRSVLGMGEDKEK